MANTNPLAAMKIKKLIGFKQITPGVITGNLITALKQCGIDNVISYSNLSSQFSVGQMSVLGNTFYGVKMDTPASKNIGNIIFNIASIADMVNHPVQVGLRLAQSAYSGSSTSNSMLMVSKNPGNSHYDFTPRIELQGEDSSLYCELVFSAKKTGSTYSLTIDVYINKQRISNHSNAYMNVDDHLGLQVGPYTMISSNAPFSLMAGDMYIAELDYNSDGTVTPQLLGNLTLEPFTVASYTGDKHTNTKNQDIVTALNTLDPNNDMGVLAIKPVEQAASVTFNAPGIAGKSIYGAALNIVYKDSISPNNRLSYQITEGTTQMAAETITERNADITGYTTFSKILTTPEGGGAWNADNLKFKLDMVNKGVE
ncbi:hypothetical protein LB105_003359 [Salmonella enterica]|uniref:Uncharacterized protein n=1 Tax=Salmonella enterica subsp. enterica serovar Panama TaxID=29472 RepID=A0A5U8JC27_SALET|nr:hypothetical protein [Salmonella enterica]EBR7993330.1 hypothetical protein [Salmonella enterica subsp. enterica serovar Panama]ECC9937716.1 hypothetical protein [Salmonella enterica subsp. enterica]ASD84999.1 hypothetical protein LFZ16_01290 [Salmonella enterica subsp. enterica serovar India str. SA20085604]EBR8434111.1 hypothetical protein [Salmonella enterica subsp. enterica serovar Panama]EID3013504.1 hypothetical protein [Salmonella enterica]